MKVLLLTFLLPYLAFGHELIERDLSLAEQWKADPMTGTLIDPSTAEIRVRTRHGSGKNLFGFSIWRNNAGPQVGSGALAEQACPSVNPTGTSWVGKAPSPLPAWITTTGGPNYPNVGAPLLYTSDWNFTLNNFINTTGILDKVAAQDGENLNINFCIRFEMNNTATQVISFEEIAIYLKLDTVTQFTTRFGAIATNPEERTSGVLEGAVASAVRCSNEGIPVNQGDAVCLNICLTKYPAVRIQDIYSLVYQAGTTPLPSPGGTGIQAAMINGNLQDLSELGSCETVGTPATVHCCMISTVLPGDWFPPYTGLPRNVTAVGSVRVMINGRRSLLRLPVRMLEDDTAVREFETQVELAPAAEDSGAFRSLTYLGLINAIGVALLI